MPPTTVAVTWVDMASSFSFADTLHAARVFHQFLRHFDTQVRLKAISVAARHVHADPGGQRPTIPTLLHELGRQHHHDGDRLPVDTVRSITLQPVGESAAAGTSVTISANASGTATPTGQWQLSPDGGVNFVNMLGATTLK